MSNKIFVKDEEIAEELVISTAYTYKLMCKLRDSALERCSANSLSTFQERNPYLIVFSAHMQKELELTIRETMFLVWFHKKQEYEIGGFGKKHLQYLKISRQFILNSFSLDGSMPTCTK